MFDLDGDVVGEVRKLAMNSIHDVESMANPIEEIRVPEGDVLRASIHLGADVLKYDLAWYDTELAIVDRHDRAMTTTVFAAAARFGVTDNPTVSRWHLKRNILVQGRQGAAVLSEYNKQRKLAQSNTAHQHTGSSAPVSFVLFPFSFFIVAVSFSFSVYVSFYF